MIIQNSHEKIYHFAVRDTLVNIRQEYWILRGRQAVKRVIGRCIVCRRFGGKPLTQTTGDLPFDRVNRSPPFKIIGLDCAGPLHISDSNEKVYVLLITCAVVRAVHFEVIRGLNLEKFLNGFRRFMAGRGTPEKVYSDNFSTFKKAARELHAFNKIVRSEKTKEFAASRKIDWEFIPVYASWFGGFYERIVGTMKSALKKTLGRSTLNLDQLSTVIKEIQHVINQRPLCAVHDDPDELDVLTPNHFLFSEYMTSGGDLETDQKGSELVRIWRSQRSHVENCWATWSSSYISQLRSFHLSKPINRSTIKVGDVVIVTDKLKPRFQWKLARVVKVDNPDLPRRCELRIAGSKQQHVRAIQHLVPLEVTEQ
jgi:hypothetical protein